MTGEAYKNKSYFVSSYNGESNNTTLVDTYECYNKDCVGYDYSDTINKAIIYDGEYYLYDFNSKDKTKLSIDGKIDGFIYFVETSNKLYSLSLYNNNQGNAFYNLDTNTVVTKYQYGDIYALDSLNSIIASIGQDTVLINPSSGNVERTLSGLQHISSVHVNGNTYYQSYPYSEGPTYSRITLVYLIVILQLQ